MSEASFIAALSKTPRNGRCSVAAAFDPVLDTRMLDGVDLCSLGCVCRGLAAKVGQFWSEAAACPGMLARCLRIDEDEKEERVVAVRLSRDPSVHGRHRKGAAWVFDGPSYAPACSAPCDSCGTPTCNLPYPFDGNFEFSLCRKCFASAESHITRDGCAARFRVAPCSELIDLYLTPLPVSMVAYPVQLRMVGPKAKRVDLIFAHGRPHACIRRVAAFALIRRVLRELHDHWRRKGRLKE